MFEGTFSNEFGNPVKRIIKASSLTQATHIAKSIAAKNKWVFHTIMLLHVD